ncbi:TonB-dependent receptor [Chondromyces crocatus]|uniref:TonB-dependent receptor n=1 Tax=Chondromyces crocatus TaxID=52 RepID=A0A0K1EFS9_CHOCO|nr:TonB-dependent receptor plug domain-containing protein [Chondromyces crocatus]AKT39438.1 TonB-dependent receptor [Chondromyces crocatus]
MVVLAQPAPGVPQPAPGAPAPPGPEGASSPERVSAEAAEEGAAGASDVTEGDAEGDAAAAPVDADSSEPSDAGEGDASVDTPSSGPLTVRVSGARRGPAPRAGGDYQLVVGQLIDVPRTSAERLLTLAPGLFLANHGGEGHPSAVFLRGFDAGEGQDIEFTLQGIPLNEPSNPHGHGFADTNFMISRLVERLRVVEGPFDVRQGDFAVAGSAEYTLGMPDRGVVARAGYGTFNRTETTVLWGPKGFGSDTFVGVEWIRGDGWGKNRAHQAARAVGQIGWALDEDTRLKVLATSYAARYDTAGVIRLDDLAARRVPGCGSDFDEQFFCSYDPNQGGAVQRHGIGAQIERKGEDSALDAQLFATVKNLRSRENFTGYELDVGNSGAPQRGDGTEQIYDAVTLGSRGSYTRTFDWLGRSDAEVGYFFRHDRADATLRRLRRADGVPYSRDFDNGLRITNAAAYASLNVRPLRWLSLRGGVRLDSFLFGVEDRNQPEVDRSGVREPSSYSEAFGVAIQPRGVVTVIVAPWLSWMTSLGLGTRSSDAQALSDGESAPFARVIAAETALVTRSVGGGPLTTEARLSTFATRVTNDLVFDERRGRNTPIGASSRFGATIWGRITHPGIGFDLASSLTWSEAYLPPDDASPFDLAAGSRLPYVPRWVFRLDASERYPFTVRGEKLRATAAVGLQFVDRRPLPFEQLGAPYATVDAAARLRWRWFELGAEMTNLFDRRNREVELNYPSNFADPEAPASQLPARHIIAGAPFQVLGTLTAYLDHEEPES